VAVVEHHSDGSLRAESVSNVGVMTSRGISGIELSPRLIRHCNRRFRLAAIHHENKALLAGLKMLHRPDQFLDLRAGGLGIEPGKTGLVQFVFQGFEVDHRFFLGVTGMTVAP